MRAKLLSLNHWKSWLWSFVRLVLIVGLSFVILYPILQKISTAIKSPVDLYSPIVVWIPMNFTLDNFKNAILTMDYWHTLLNSFLLAGMTTILTAMSCALAGYGFARLRFRGSNLLFAGVILTILVPPTTILIPLYLNLKDFFGMNLLNTYWPFVLTSITAVSYKAGLFIFIFRQFFRGIPKEVEEAAYVDGAGVGTTFARIMLPNSIPAILTVSLFSFVWQWNDSFFTTTYLTTAKVIPIMLSSLPHNLAVVFENEDPFFMSMIQDTGILLAMLPLILIYLFVQRYFVESVERTGVVG